MILRVLIQARNELAEQWKTVLSQHHFWAISVADKDQAMEALKKQHFHVCIWSTENGDQIDEIYKLKKIRPTCSVVSYSDQQESGFIVSCIKAGASHFISCRDGYSSLEGILPELKALDQEATEPSEHPIESWNMVGRHSSMQKIYQLIDRIKQSDCSVLISGESGTGKELVAQAIHTASARSNRSLIAVNCAAIPATLLESELFGHVKGAFTGATQNRTGRFQLAGKGTLLLDEISELSMDLQAKLLRAIQTRQFEPVGSIQSIKLEARIIAATNQDLETAVSQRTFREDLFYRLNVLPIVVPPLRQRRSDIPLLVHSFVTKYSKMNRKNIRGISEEAMTILVRYNWPGNVRELENLVERVVVLKQENSLIEPSDFPGGYFRNVDLGRFVANVALPEDGVSFNEAVNDFENELILQALKKTDGNKNQAATLLKLNRTTLVEKLKRKGLKFAC